MDIRSAHPEDAARLTEIAHQSATFWGYPEQRIEMWREQLTVTPEYVASSESYAAWVESFIVGFYLLRRSGDTFCLEHMWVLPAWTGKGFGRALFLQAAAGARELGAAYVEAESDPNAEEFFRRMGAHLIGTARYVLDGEPRYLPLLRYDLQEDDGSVGG